MPLNFNPVTPFPEYMYKIINFNTVSAEFEEIYMSTNKQMVKDWYSHSMKYFVSIIHSMKDTVSTLMNEWKYFVSILMNIAQYVLRWRKIQNTSWH